MIPAVDGYEWKGDAFRNRQHLVNHVDMLFGLGTEEWSAGRDRRVALNVLGRDGKPHASSMWRYNDETVLRGRRWVLHQSLHAASWEQLYPMHGDKYFSPEDLADTDDLYNLLNECIDIWACEEPFGYGSWEKFQEANSFVVLLGTWDPVRIDRIVIRQRPATDVEQLPVPVNGRRVMGTRHEGRTEWRAFADRICQNEHVKAELAARQGGKCAICGHELGSRAVIHHVDYDHECGLALTGNEWRVPGTRVRPDCELCHAEHGELFEECISRLRAVHSDCNYLIEATL